MSDVYKEQAARAALSELKSGMRLGLGTGSTARYFVSALGEMVAAGFECICVPTSEVTADQARSLNIPLSDLDTLEILDLTIDGADEIDTQRNLIKGAGGALWREKIVADSSRRMVVIADAGKLVENLGAFPLPIEVNAFGLGATKRRIEKVLADNNAADGMKLRLKANGESYVTDGGHLIFDAFFGRISDAKALSDALLNVPGVVQHGLFLDMCSAAYVAGANGVTKLGD